MNVGVTVITVKDSPNVLCRPGKGGGPAWASPTQNARVNAELTSAAADRGDTQDTPSELRRFLDGLQTN